MDLLLTRLLHVIMQTATMGGPTAANAAAGTADVNNPGRPYDPGAEQWPEDGGELPTQMGGTRTTLLPDIYTFKLPDNIAQLWKDQEIEDGRPYLPNGQPNPTKGQKIVRKVLKFDRNSPLVVVGGPHDGEPMTWNPTNNPRPRGKKDDPKTAWISDLAYLLDQGLQGGIDPKQRVRPTTAAGLVAEINKYAGKTVKLETGLAGQCRSDKVKYIVMDVANENFNPQVAESAANPRTVQTTMLDPTGGKGCGKRYYTDKFKNPAFDKTKPVGPDNPEFDLEIECENPVVDPQTGVANPCGAVVRGFESVERILSPHGR